MTGVSEPKPSYLRALLVLGRVSNLPTVWSNCLAGWWLGRGGEYITLLQLMVGASALYIGGMYLNDACDADFDRQHRQERPIPRGVISLAQVWILGTMWLLLGIGLLAPHSGKSAILTLLLVGAILLYDAVHKLVAFSPVLMALCRFLLFLLAASFGQFEIDGLVIWSGLVLAGYIVGLSYIARRESTQGVIGFWPLLPMAAPLVLAYIVNAGPHRDNARLLSLVLILWVLKSLKPLWRAAHRNIGQVVSHLLAGICLVDLLAVADVPREIGLLFLGFFGLSLLFQRYIPAT
jgi:hypothetical protein